MPRNIPLANINTLLTGDVLDESAHTFQAQDPMLDLTSNSAWTPLRYNITSTCERAAPRHEYTRTRLITEPPPGYSDYTEEYTQIDRRNWYYSNPFEDHRPDMARRHSMLTTRRYDYPCGCKAEFPAVMVPVLAMCERCGREDAATFAGPSDKVCLLVSTSYEDTPSPGWHWHSICYDSLADGGRLFNQYDYPCGCQEFVYPYQRALRVPCNRHMPDDKAFQEKIRKRLLESVPTGSQLCLSFLDKTHDPIRVTRRFGRKCTTTCTSETIIGYHRSVGNLGVTTTPTASPRRQRRRSARRRQA